MKPLALVAVLSASLPTIASASDIVFQAKNRFPVAEIGNATFEVIARGGRVGARDYWCAAGDYAFSRGARTNARIYLARPEGPSQAIPGRKAVQFTLDPQKASVTPIEPQLSLTVKVPGDNLSVALARQYCYRTIDTF